MYVNAKKIAYLGLLLAFSVILVILSSIFEFNTLFFLGASSFLVGIAIRECGYRLGVGFYIAAVLLSLILAPNKIYCLTYTCFGLYIVVVEGIWSILWKKKQTTKTKVLFLVLKYILFNIMYIPALIFLPSLVYTGTINSMVMAGLVIGGQVVLFVYDKAYYCFQIYYGNKIRKHIKL